MTTEQTALQRLKEVCEDATPVSWDTIPYIKISRTALPALIELCEALERYVQLHDRDAYNDYELWDAVLVAKARLEEVCPK